MPPEFSLSWLLAPLSVEAFLRDVWGATHLHVARDQRDYADGLRATAGTVDELLASFRPHLSLVSLNRNGERKPQYVYRLADGAFDTAAVGRDFAAGFTIVLENVQRYAPAIAELAQAIEVDLNYAVQVNAYFTPPESQGFVVHCDDHDALIVQLDGSKVWHIFDADVATHRVMRHEPVSASGLPEPVDACLHTGDVLYLPRGRVHAAESTHELSVHLTIGLHAPTLSTLATRILAALGESDDAVHTRLPPRFLSDPGVRAGLGAAAGEIAAAVRQPQALERALDSFETDLIRRGQCVPLGSGLADAIEIDDDTQVFRFRPLYARLADRDGQVVLSFAQSEVTAVPAHRDALAFVAGSTTPFAIREIPDLTTPQRLELARTLLMHGFLVRFPGR